MTAEEIKALLQLEPHPVEGGWYRRTYTSEVSVALLRGVRPYGTAIYYLLEEGTFSEMHVLASDEIFHFYLGDPVEMLQLYPIGAIRVLLTLGPDLAAGQHVQLMFRQACGRATRLWSKAAKWRSRLHRHARLRFRRLPQRELCGAGGGLAARSGADQEADESLS